MQQFYTSIEIENDSYIGVAYNSNNNAIEYRSKNYPSQMQAMMDVTNYLKEKVNPGGSKQQIITNRTTYQTASPQSQPPRRCCGR